VKSTGHPTRAKVWPRKRAVRVENVRQGGKVGVKAGAASGNGRGKSVPRVKTANLKRGEEATPRKLTLLDKLVKIRSSKRSRRNSGRQKGRKKTRKKNLGKRQKKSVVVHKSVWGGTAAECGLVHDREGNGGEERDRFNTRPQSK